MSINIFKAQDMLKNMSKQQLVTEAQNPTGSAPAFMVHARLAEIGEQEKEAQRASSEQDTTTVAQDVVQGAGVGGLGSMTQAFNPRAKDSSNNGAFDPRTVPDNTGRQQAPVGMKNGGEVGADAYMKNGGMVGKPTYMAEGGEVKKEFSEMSPAERLAMDRDFMIRHMRNPESDPADTDRLLKKFSRVYGEDELNNLTGSVSPQSLQNVQPMGQPSIADIDVRMPTRTNGLGGLDAMRGAPTQPVAPASGGGLDAIMAGLDNVVSSTKKPAVDAYPRGTMVDGTFYNLMPDNEVLNARTGEVVSPAVASVVRAKLNPVMPSGPELGSGVNPSYVEGQTLNPSFDGVNPSYDENQVVGPPMSGAELINRYPERGVGTSPLPVMRPDDSNITQNGAYSRRTVMDAQEEAQRNIDNPPQSPGFGGLVERRDQIAAGLASIPSRIGDGLKNDAQIVKDFGQGIVAAGSNFVDARKNDLRDDASRAKDIGQGIVAGLKNDVGIIKDFGIGIGDGLKNDAGIITDFGQARVDDIKNDSALVKDYFSGLEVEETTFAEQRAILVSRLNDPEITPGMKTMIQNSIDSIDTRTTRGIALDNAVNKVADGVNYLGDGARNLVATGLGAFGDTGMNLGADILDGIPESREPFIPKREAPIPVLSAETDNPDSDVNGAPVVQPLQDGTLPADLLPPTVTDTVRAAPNRRTAGQGQGGIASTPSGPSVASEAVLAEAMAEKEAGASKAKWLMLAEIGAGMLGSTKPGFAGTGDAVSAGLASYNASEEMRKAEERNDAAMTEDKRRYEQNRKDAFQLASMKRSGASAKPMAASQYKAYVDQRDAAQERLSSLPGLDEPGAFSSFFFGSEATDPIPDERTDLTNEVKRLNQIIAMADMRFTPRGIASVESDLNINVQ